MEFGSRTGEASSGRGGENKGSRRGELLAAAGMGVGAGEWSDGWMVE